MAREAGFDEHFTKPLDPAQLARALRSASRKLELAETAATPKNG
jgi:CheY-like chemotaxis protein